MTSLNQGHDLVLHVAWGSTWAAGGMDIGAAGHLGMVAVSITSMLRIGTHSGVARGPPDNAAWQAPIGCHL